ncbi:MarR family winged helix-turn-helix transcriptional regulator [Hespellia stercorisuis]|uniref:DNA-binding transcriptional regulator, MarR family n=1 Tax=Hespellia stercorisuis DSM 15480 TaxID=1121950 RepID=A0A1M6WJK3_9FIRM|nr:MarR family transcriptional regulator [Hespellia stercorisuis]SHK93888.1 DNA-binding transcriptional regulator, MarR family [Hespellia stercorisuis DSM 15480]
MDKKAYIEEFAALQQSLAKLKNASILTESVKGENYVLRYLTKAEADVNPKEISKILNVSSARTAVILKNLEKRELVRRYQDPDSHRQTLVKILPAGIEKNLLMQKTFENSVSDLIDALGEEDFRQYMELKKRVLSYYEQKQSGKKEL